MKRYLSRPEVAERIGVKPDTLNRYKLPEPDAQIGARQLGWLPETIDAWNASRPGRRGPVKRERFDGGTPIAGGFTGISGSAEILPL